MLARVLSGGGPLELGQHFRVVSFKPCQSRAGATDQARAVKLKSHADQTQAPPTLNTAHPHSKFLRGLLQRECAAVGARRVNGRAIRQTNRKRGKIIDHRGAHQ